MATIGNISFMETNVPEMTHTFMWIIPNFFSLSSENSSCYFSPPFVFAGETWNMFIYPNGDEENTGFISLYLLKISSDLPVKLEFSLGLKTVNGEKYLEHYRTYEFQKKREGMGACQVVSRSDLLRRKDIFPPTSLLKVFCSIKYPQAEKCASSSTANARCPHCKMTLDNENVLSHEERCVVRCPKCSDAVILQKWHEHNCQGTSAKDFESVCEDYKNVLLHGHNHDLILKVGDRELRVHRDILKARSHVFYSMLSHDMMEKNSDAIKIPDCDPEAVELFLVYVYSGRVEGLDQSNMFGLYYVADKYEMSGLKEKCHNFIKKSLSTTNFCDVIQLALNHSDNSLLEYATEYFSDNMLHILRTVEWQSFMKTNSTVANELFIKSCEKKK